MAENQAYVHQPRYTPEEIEDRRRRRSAAAAAEAQSVCIANAPADAQPAPADPDPEGRLLNSDWCQCEHCQYVPSNATLKMCVCCREQMVDFEEYL